ncbi:hypothetical protein DsansV1_C07g0071531 [Dioscorea sansibarensis]
MIIVLMQATTSSVGSMHTLRVRRNSQNSLIAHVNNWVICASCNLLKHVSHVSHVLQGAHNGQVIVGRERARRSSFITNRELMNFPHNKPKQLIQLRHPLQELHLQSFQHNIAEQITQLKQILTFETRNSS